MTWMRLEVQSMRVGWTARLPPEQYCAWIKFLLEVKASGLRGRCKSAYFGADWSAKYLVPETAFADMMARAVTEKAVTTCNGFYKVAKWKTFQIDPGHAKRQEGYRNRQNALPGSAKGPVTVRDESDGDSTLQDVTATSTAQDSTENKGVAVVAAPPGAATAKTEERAGLNPAVPAAATTERPLTLKLKRIQEALAAPVVDRTAIDAAALLGSTGLAGPVAAKLGMRYGYERVREILALVVRRRADHPAGMTRDALEENWQS